MKASSLLPQAMKILQTMTMSYEHATAHFRLLYLLIKSVFMKRGAKRRHCWHSCVEDDPNDYDHIRTATIIHEFRKKVRCSSFKVNSNEAFWINFSSAQKHWECWLSTSLYCKTWLQDLLFSFLQAFRQTERQLELRLISCDLLPWRSISFVLRKMSDSSFCFTPALQQVISYAPLLTTIGNCPETN